MHTHIHTHCLKTILVCMYFSFMCYHPCLFTTSVGPLSQQIWTVCPRDIGAHKAEGIYCSSLYGIVVLLPLEYEQILACMMETDFTLLIMSSFRSCQCLSCSGK